MADVVPLFEGSLPAGQIAEDVVEVLARWLEEARAGEITCVVLGGVRPSGAVSTEWAGRNANRTLTVASAIQARVQRAWLQALDGGDE